MNIFDKIYIINCKNSTGRKDMMERQLKDLKMENYMIIEGCEKKDIDIERLKVEKKIIPNHTSIKLTPVEMAADESHKKCYHDIIDNNYKNSLILEDDVLFTMDTAKNFFESLKTLPSDYDMAYLGNIPKKHVFEKHCFNISNQNFWGLKGGFTGAHMYSVSINGAKNIIKNYYPYKGAPDGILDNMLQKKILNGYLCKRQYGINGSLGIPGNMMEKLRKYGSEELFKSQIQGVN
jgi:GR25 family glycosyltransferase involved in LPS biosynthesis